MTKIAGEGEVCKNVSHRVFAGGNWKEHNSLDSRIPLDSSNVYIKCRKTIA